MHGDFRSKDQVKIQFDDDVDREALSQVIQLFSEATGKEVRSVQGVEEFGSGSFQEANTITLSVGDLPRGTYYLRLTNRDGNADHARVVLE